MTEEDDLKHINDNKKPKIDVVKRVMVAKIGDQISNLEKELSTIWDLASTVTDLGDGYGLRKVGNTRAEVDYAGASIKETIGILRQVRTIIEAS